MLQAALTFFILGLLAMLLGSFGIAGLSIDAGEMILSIFFIFSLLSFIGSAEIERKKHNLHH
ncbi:MAG: DUF1328 domain-containing protein [Bacteriovorax sp.]|nr:DUF1328 domain-containing protein [Bacteriovorax sp.]